jgi:uncharacterized BrkB/YihY/UPF0761 family membrane protein
MSENENAVVANEVQPADPSQPTKGQKFKAGLKEWGRKKIVGLKRNTQIIPLLLLLVSSIFYLCCLNTFSQALYKVLSVELAGFAMFVNTLLSLLVLVIFLNAFPKRKKPRIVAIVGVFVVMAIIILCDVLFYVKLDDYVGTLSEKFLTRNPIILDAFDLVIAHIVLVGIALVAFATLPLYKKLIMKINTRKVVESNEMQGEIDTSAEV